MNKKIKLILIKILTFILIFSCLFLTSCSIKKDESSLLVTRSFLQTIAEKYNKYSYNYEFDKDTGMSTDGAVTYLIANISDFKTLVEKQSDGYDSKKISYSPQSFYEALEKMFIMNKTDKTSFYYNKEQDCYIIPKMEDITPPHKTVVNEIKKVESEVFTFDTIVSAMSSQTNSYETTMKQTFTVETDGNTFKFLSVKIDWVLPGFYNVKH